MNRIIQLRDSTHRKQARQQIRDQHGLDQMTELLSKNLRKQFESSKDN